MRIFIILLIFLSYSTYFLSQSVVINEEFSSVNPIGWTSSVSKWDFSYNYGTNSYSGSYCARLSSATNANGRYIYIPISAKNGYTYTITFYTKRICGLSINVSTAANQATLLANNTYTNSSCNSNFNTWYSWSSTFFSTSAQTIYFQILATSVYGAPTSIYLDNLNIIESEPVSLPIELLYFKGKNRGSYNKLEWASATENNNDYYSLWHSADGSQWNLRTIITGAGNSSHTITYEYLDPFPSDGINYYMLEQTDFDGKNKKYDDEIISVVYNNRNLKVIRATDLMGKDIDPERHKGFFIVVYEDLTTSLSYRD